MRTYPKVLRLCCKFEAVATFRAKFDSWKDFPRFFWVDNARKASTVTNFALRRSADNKTSCEHGYECDDVLHAYERI